jgi:uncharacterized protein
MPGFIINLAVLKPGRSRVEAEADAQTLDLPGAEWPGPVQGHLNVERTGDQVTVTGKVQAVARLECVRCLKIFDRPVEVDLTVFADRSGSSPRLEEDLERDHYMKFHDGRQLDLRDETREALLLELPITPHCQEACRGLCPRCGSDLNLGPCGCPESP